MYLASYLRSKGLQVDILDVKGGDRPKDLAQHIFEIEDYLMINETPKFIGLAAFHSDYPMIHKLGDSIKYYCPDTKLLVGNAHATLDPQDFIYPESDFDFAILGEGEETCYELWRFFYGEKGIDERLGDIPGIAFTSYITKNSEFIRTERRAFKDLSDLSMPAYDLIDMDYYISPQKLIIRRIYTSMVCIFAGRGCPFNCDFCAANNVWGANKGKAARLRPVDDVIQEINYLKKKYKIDFFYLFDDMFGMDREWVRKWFYMKQALLDKPTGEIIPYACQTRADIATEEMIRGLKESGCIQLDIGVESGSQQLLDHVNKGIVLQQVRQVFTWCRKYKLRSFATMLLNLPGETLEDLKQTKKFLGEIKPSAGLIYGICTPYPGTKIYEDHCCPRLTVGEYSSLINARLNPNNERFRMSEHKEDLWKLLDTMNRKYKVNPMFERMWCLRPFQKLYWGAVLRSTRLSKYLMCWLMDIPKTLILWWLHRLGIYRLAKKLQYGDKWK